MATVAFYSGCTPCCPTTPTGVSGACCSGFLTALTLHGTITSGGSIDGTYTFNYNSGIPGWEYLSPVGTCGSGIRFVCNTGSDQYNIQTFVGAWVPPPVTTITTTCSPFDVLFDNIGGTFCGSATQCRMEFTS